MSQPAVIKYWYFPRYISNPTGSWNIFLPKDAAEKHAVAEREAYIGKQHLQKDPANDLQAIVYATYEQGDTVQVNDLMTGEWFSVPIREWERTNWAMSLTRSRFRTVKATILMNADGSASVTSQVAHPTPQVTRKPRRSMLTVYVMNPDDEKKLKAMLPTLRQVVPTLDWDQTWELEDEN